MSRSPNETVKEKLGSAWAALLQPILAEECSLLVRTQIYRGNVRGPNSPSLHQLFDDQRRQIDGWLAQLLQSTREAGLSVCESIDGLTRASLATESPPVDLSGPEMIQDLRARHEELSRRLRRDAAQWRDPPTLQLLQRLADFHDTAAWILQVVLNGPGSVGLEENYFYGAPDASGRV
jgi:DNA-binding ferritin-like protein